MFLYASGEPRYVWLRARMSDFTAESADPFHATNERSQRLGLHPFEFFGRGPFFQEALKFLVDRLFQSIEGLALLGCRDYGQLTAYFLLIDERKNVGSNLVVINQPLIKP